MMNPTSVLRRVGRDRGEREDSSHRYGAYTPAPTTGEGCTELLHTTPHHTTATTSTNHTPHLEPYRSFYIDEEKPQEHSGQTDPLLCGKGNISVQKKINIYLFL